MAAWQPEKTHMGIDQVNDAICASAGGSSFRHLGQCQDAATAPAEAPGHTVVLCPGPSWTCADGAQGRGSTRLQLPE